MPMQLYPRKMSAKATAFFKRKLRKNIAEGKPFKQSIAIAFSQTRRAGYRTTPLRSTEMPPKSMFRKKRAMKK